MCVLYLLYNMQGLWQEVIKFIHVCGNSDTKWEEVMNTIWCYLWAIVLVHNFFNLLQNVVSVEEVWLNVTHNSYTQRQAFFPPHCSSVLKGEGRETVFPCRISRKGHWTSAQGGKEQIQTQGAAMMRTKKYG